jgi:hypothetical protein
MGSVIAVSPAASKPGFGSGDWPIAGISKARKDGSIIATASGNIASAAAGRA